MRCSGDAVIRCLCFVRMIQLLNITWRFTSTMWSAADAVVEGRSVCTVTSEIAGSGTLQRNNLLLSVDVLLSF
jgi:hypothetical protein